MSVNDKNNMEGVFEPIEEIDPVNLATDTPESPVKPSLDDSVIVPKETDRTSDAPKSAVGFSPLLWILLVVVIAGILIGFVNIYKWQERANEARARLAMGQAQMIDGDSFGALYQFTRAVELDPKIPDANSSLGRIAIENGQADEAVRKFQAELALNPDDRESHLALGCLYTLGCIPDDDPHSLRAYINESFGNVVACNWPPDLAYTPEPGTDPLSSAVYHFQYALERLPNDPTPEIGLALNHIANYQLGMARERLSRLLAQSQDEGAIAVAINIIDDINSEEEYETWLAQNPNPATSGADVTEPLLGPPESLSPLASGSVQPSDMSDELLPIPGFSESGSFDPNSFTSSVDSSGGFGSRTIDPSLLAGGGNQSLPGMQLTEQNLVPQPTVKPITNDIHIESTNEFVRTYRIANIFESGSVGFREGETIVMPGTSVEVKVLESSEDRIVLEEHGHQFVWVPGEVGWVQSQEEPSTETSEEVSETTEPAETELGPEVETE